MSCTSTRIYILDETRDLKGEPQWDLGPRLVANCSSSFYMFILIQEWAVHTGRFTEGVDQPDWPTWKTRFRVALTKLPDFKELKEQNQLEGNIAEPFRVYQFVQRTRKCLNVTMIYRLRRDFSGSLC